MKSITRYILLLAALLLSLIGFGNDRYFPEPMTPKRMVNDYVGILSTSESQALEQKLRTYNDSTTIEIAIVIVDTLYGYEVSDYAFKLGDKWGIGKKSTSNGVLILVSMNDRKMFIATGRGMEGAIPDIIAGRIYRNEMAPEFKKGNYYIGLSKAADAIIAASRNEYKASHPPQSGEGNGDIVGMGFVFMIIVLLILIFASNKRGGGGGTYVSRHGADIITGAILSDLLRGGSSGGGWSSGSGSSWGGGGGFGGFGGGSFGGGGAGGSW